MSIANDTWDPDAGTTVPATTREEFAAMVARVDAAALGTGVHPTPAIHGAEDAFDLIAQRHERGEATRAEVTAAIARIEELWMVAIARARRQAAK